MKDLHKHLGRVSVPKEIQVGACFFNATTFVVAIDFIKRREDDLL